MLSELEQKNLIEKKKTIQKIKYKLTWILCENDFFFAQAILN